MSPRKLAELSRSELRHEVTKSLLIITSFSVAILVTYFTLPFDNYDASSQSIGRLAVGITIFGFILFFMLKRITKADIPQLRAGETLVISLLIFLCFYASVYLSVSNVDAQSFSLVLNHVSALYFTVVTFGTVGYGDISAQTDLARMLVSVQILIDLVFIAALVRLVVLVSQSTLKRDDA